MVTHTRVQVQDKSFLWEIGSWFTERATIFTTCQQTIEAGNLSHFATQSSNLQTPTMAELEQKLKNRLEESIKSRDAHQVWVGSND